MVDMQNISKISYSFELKIFMVLRSDRNIKTRETKIESVSHGDLKS